LVVLVRLLRDDDLEHERRARALDAEHERRTSFFIVNLDIGAASSAIDLRRGRVASRARSSSAVTTGAGSGTAASRATRRFALRSRMRTTFNITRDSHGRSGRSTGTRPAAASHVSCAMSSAVLGSRTSARASRPSHAISAVSCSSRHRASRPHLEHAAVAATVRGFLRRTAYVPRVAVP
jgi:hypothetical protein